MSADTPSTAAWNRLRDTLATIAADHRADGRTVVEAHADNGAVRAVDDGPLTFVFTVPGETATALGERTTASAVCRTEVRYVDAAGYRLYLLEVRQSDDAAVALVAGGIRRRSLAAHADTSGPARTRVRSVTDTVALELAHDDRTPFLAGLE